MEHPHPLAGLVMAYFLFMRGWTNCFQPLSVHLKPILLETSCFWSSQVQSVGLRMYLYGYIGLSEMFRLASWWRCKLYSCRYDIHHSAADSA
jgi:hypothetical protein